VDTGWCYALDSRVSQSSQGENEIQGDSKRRAPHLLKGVTFQLWHSVLAWIGLGDEDRLFLEGAEDFDVLNEESASVNQTRATAKPISLASSKVVEALGNYWKIQTLNPGRFIVYHYITTSIATVESGSPFGAQVCGIDVWNRCISGSPDIARLRNFLLQNIELPAHLKAFVESAKDETLFDQLISKVHWDTEQGELPELEQTVRQRLICHGDRKGISVQSAARVADTLFAHVAALASEKGTRSLVRPQFLEAFEAATHMSMPQDIVTQILNRLAGGDRKEGALPSLSLVERSTPPRRGVFGKRIKLECAVSDHLNAHPFAVLYGATGNGKTSLAAAIAGTYRGILWASFTTLAPEESRLLTREVFAALSETSSCGLIVLDDFCFEALHARAITQELGILLALAESKRCRIIFTSQKPMPLSLLNTLGRAASSNLAVGAFDDDELTDLVKLYGCPVELAQAWAKIVFLHTSGHPQLTHARLLSLQRENWPAQSQEAIFQPPEDVQEVKTKARALLSETSEDQAELIYRLSLLPGRFRRDHALTVAQIEPKLRNPGDIFDRLTGPWIEQVSGSYFRISPLLDNAAVSAWSASKCNAERESIALAVAESGRLTGIEVNHVLFLAFMCRSRPLLSYVTKNLNCADMAIKEASFPHIFWFGDLPVSDHALLFPENSSLNWGLRTLQLQVAAHNKSQNTTAIAEAIAREVTENTLREHYRGPRLASLLQIVSTPEAKLPVPRLLAMLQEIAELRTFLLAEGGEEADLCQFVNLSSFYGREVDLGSFLFLFIGQRCEDGGFLADLLRTLEAASSELLSRFVAFWEVEPFLAQAIIDKVWLAVENMRDPDWRGVLATMDEVVRFGERHGVTLMRDVGLRAKIVICDEYLDEPDKARRIIEGPEFLSPSPLLADAAATFLSHRDDPAAALKI